jgi:hypothetical protein
MRGLVAVVADSTDAKTNAGMNMVTHNDNHCESTKGE